MIWKNMGEAGTIWKFPLQVTDVQEVVLPARAQILACQMQGKILCLWVLLDPVKAVSLPKENHCIRIIGTGHPIPPEEALCYIDTFQMDDGTLIFHVFERTRLEPCFQVDPKGEKN